MVKDLKNTLEKFNIPEGAISVEDKEKDNTQNKKESKKTKN